MDMYYKFLLALLISGIIGFSGAGAEGLSDRVMNANQEAIQNHENLIFSSAKILGAAGVAAYWMVNGEWPADFQAVRDAGFVQVDLKSETQQVVNMDDGSFDFPTDCHYLPPSGSNPPKIATLLGFEQENVVYDPVEQQLTYAESFAGMPDSFRGDFLELLAEPDRMRLAGIANVCGHGLYWHYLAKGEEPETWQEFIESGFCPLDENSVNPVTGGKIYADGRPDDLKFKFHEKSGHAIIFITDENGEVRWPTNW